MCEAFATEGVQVTLLIPRSPEAHILADFYGITDNFKVVCLPTVGSIKYGKPGYFLQGITFSISFFLYALWNKHDVIFSREELPLIIASWLSSRTVWEIHNEKINWLVKKVIRSSNHIISISPGLTQFCLKHGASHDSVTTVINAVDRKRFSKVSAISKEDCRLKTDLPLDKKILLYTGNLVDWKGVETLAAAAHYLAEDVLIVYVGRVTATMKETLLQLGVPERMMFVSEQPYEIIPLYQKAADALLLPTSAKTERARLFTSPIKLFEYLLSGVPIVATDIPSTRAILSDDTAWFAAPDDPQSLAITCEEVLMHSKADLNKKTEAANALASQNTWHNRAKEIIAKINTL